MKIICFHDYLPIWVDDGVSISYSKLRCSKCGKIKNKWG